MAWTTPRTWSTSETVTAALLNTHLRDNFSYLYDVRAERIAVLRDEKTAGTGGGSASSGSWTQRDLNTESSDPGSIVTLSSNRFTPVSGTYLIMVRTPLEFGGSAAAAVRLYNYTQTSEVLYGDGNIDGVVDASNTVNHYMYVWGVFTANGTDAYQVETYEASGSALSKGAATNLGTKEVYTQVVLWKIG